MPQVTPSSVRMSTFTLLEITAFLMRPLMLVIRENGIDSLISTPGKVGGRGLASEDKENL